MTGAGCSSPFCPAAKSCSSESPGSGSASSAPAEWRSCGPSRRCSKKRASTRRRSAHRGAEELVLEDNGNVRSAETAVVEGGSWHELGDFTATTKEILPICALAIGIGVLAAFVALALL